jgi:hypothetical protein
MFATMIRCDLCGQTGRTLAKALSALPGFVAFVALDAEGEGRRAAALCIMEDRASLAAARRRIAEWHANACGTAAGGLEEVGAGAVIAQRGL